MRKVMWCCAVLALAAAAAVYAAAEYAGHFPDTLFGRCVLKSYEAGTVYNPMYQVTQAAVGQTYAVVKKVMDHPEVVPTTVGVIPADPEPAPPSAPEPACPAPCLAPRCLPPDNPEADFRPAPMLGKVVIQPDANPPADAPVNATGGGDEEAEFVPPPMPHARENQAVPPPMPYATDDTPAEEDQAEESEAFWRLFRDASGHCTEAGGHEESEACPAGTPDCREDPRYDEQYPGCPAMGPCPRGGCGGHCGPCPASHHDDPVVEEKGEPPANADGAEEPSETPPGSIEESKGGPGVKAPGRRDVDTTEYRPSDGNPVDYSSIPY
jgi:hypothetical protein